MFESLVTELRQDILQGRNCRSVQSSVETLDTAYEIQDEVVKGLGSVCGFKIAMNAPPLMQKAGIDEPIVGVIVGNAPIANKSGLNDSEYVQLAIEPEFAAVVGQDIPAGTKLKREWFEEYIERFSLAFELLDRRNDTHDMHAPTYVANNVFNAGVVLAEDALDLSVLDAGTYGACFVAVENTLVSGQETAPQNPIDACLFVINHFSKRGQKVKVGDVILCGAHHPPLVVDAPGKYTFSLSSGEEVSLSISP